MSDLATSYSPAADAHTSHIVAIKAAFVLLDSGWPTPLPCAAQGRTPGAFILLIHHPHPLSYGPLGLYWASVVAHW